jgi:hypothetical protein
MSKAVTTTTTAPAEETQVASTTAGKSMYECIGDVCRLVRTKAPEILGTLAEVAPQVAQVGAGVVRLDPSQVIAGVKGLGGVPEKLTQLKYWEADLKIFERTLDQLQRLLNALQNQPYHKCSINYLEEVVQYAAERLVAWGDPTTATVRAQFAAWPEWYRTELSKAATNLEAALSYAILEAAHVQMILTEFWTTTDKKRKKELERLMDTCQRAPSARQVYLEFSKV